MAWSIWFAVGALAVPCIVAGVSLLLNVRFGLTAVAQTAGAAVVATGFALVLLFRDFAAFAFVGGFAVCAVAAATYAFGTSRGIEAWRDANGP
jgi:glucose uptake protein GlcU